nr:CD209 antigen-like protein E [Danio rerio]|eukprot:XP_017213618.1 CD209 antigen-like protein E [Danio rerio]
MHQRSDNYKWIYYNFSFYYTSSKKKSWEDSRQDCQQRRADLLTIKSPKENEFVKKLAVSDFWIGLKKIQGVWTWPDGGSVADWVKSFQYSTQPHCYCALMSSSGWKTASCTDSNCWICKKTII